MFFADPWSKCITSTWEKWDLCLPLACLPLWPSSRKEASLQWRCKPNKRRWDSTFRWQWARSFPQRWLHIRLGAWKRFHQSYGLKTVLWLERFKNMSLHCGPVICRSAGLHWAENQSGMTTIVHSRQRCSMWKTFCNVSQYEFMFVCGWSRKCPVNNFMQRTVWACCWQLLFSEKHT